MKKAPATGQGLGGRDMNNNTLHRVKMILISLSKIGVIAFMSIPLLSLPYIVNYKFILEGSPEDSTSYLVAKIMVVITFEFGLFFISAYLALWHTRIINTIAYYLKIDTHMGKIHKKHYVFTYYLPMLIFLHTMIKLLWKSQIDYCWETIAIGTVVVNLFLILDDGDERLNWKDMFEELKSCIKAENS